MTDYTQKAERDEMREFIGLINDGADHDRDVRLLLDACDTLEREREWALAMLREAEQLLSNPPGAGWREDCDKWLAKLREEA